MNTLISIGTTVVVEPKPDDQFQHEFIGIIKTVSDTHYTVRDQDDDCWDVDIDQVSPYIKD